MSDDDMELFISLAADTERCVAGLSKDHRAAIISGLIRAALVCYGVYPEANGYRLRSDPQCRTRRRRAKSSAGIPVSGRSNTPRCLAAVGELVEERISMITACLCNDCDALLMARGFHRAASDRDWCMLRDRVWRAATRGSPHKRFLCVTCIERRLDRRLTAKDFRRNATG